MKSKGENRRKSRREFLADLARGVGGLSLAGLAAACDPGTYWNYLTLNEADKVDERFNESMAGDAKPLIFPTAASDEFTFLWLSDVHIATGKNDLMDKLGYYAQQAGAVLVMHSGDCVDDGTEEEFQKWVELMSQYMPAPVFSALGNHDLYGDGWNMFRKYIGPSVFKFEYGACDFFFLDTAAGTLGRDQMNWLEKTLDRAIRPRRFVFSHYPVYDGAFQTPSSMGNRDEYMKLLSLFSKYRVDYYLCGHKHTGAHYDINGTEHIISGAGSPNKEIINDKQHFYRFDVAGGEVHKDKIYFDDVEMPE